MMSAQRLLPFALCLVTGLVHADGAALGESPGRTQISVRPQQPAPAPEVLPPQPQPVRPRQGDLTSAITLADLGFRDGFRFANLGGRLEIFVPLPQGGDISSTELVLALDDVSAHEARRNLEVLVNDRTVSAIALDGRGSARKVRVALGKARPRDGFLKLSLVVFRAPPPRIAASTCAMSATA